jgi:DNA-binding FrmR family transcriptional regulator
MGYPDINMSPGHRYHPTGLPDQVLQADGGVKSSHIKRLRRIEGQLRGLQKMVDEERDYADILTQISSAHEALRAVGRELLREQLKRGAAAMVTDGVQREALCDELVDLMYKHSR